LTAEIDFNHRAGLTDDDDRLPELFHKEALAPRHETLPYGDKDLHGTFAAIRQTLEEQR
jgi:aldehyde:ferredoxin oxidoreductase